MLAVLLEVVFIKKHVVPKNKIHLYLEISSHEGEFSSFLLLCFREEDHLLT